MDFHYEAADGRTKYETLNQTNLIKEEIIEIISDDEDEMQDDQGDENLQYEVLDEVLLEDELQAEHEPEDLLVVKSESRFRDIVSDGQPSASDGGACSLVSSTRKRPRLYERFTYDIPPKHIKCVDLHCNETFDNYNDRRRHLTVVHSDILKCPKKFCRYHDKCRDKISKHFHKTHTDSYMCRACNLSFENEKRYLKHNSKRHE